jgi:hypothetical protein
MLKGRIMLRNKLMGLVFAGALATSAWAADVFVHIGPPRPLVERRGPAPGRGYVWIPGYHRWDGRTHIWVPGRWELAPRPRAHWVAHHWVKRRGGWVFVEGHWR